jgi:hypothetical protein
VERPSACHLVRLSSAQWCSDQPECDHFAPAKQNLVHNVNRPGNSASCLDFSCAWLQFSRHC